MLLEDERTIPYHSAGSNELKLCERIFCCLRYMCLFGRREESHVATRETHVCDIAWK